MIIHLFNLATFENTALIDHINGDVGSLYIMLNLRAPHQLNITINSKFSRINDVIRRNDFGIRIQESNQDLLFIFESREVKDDYTVELKMLSYSYKLQLKRLDNMDRDLRGYSLATFLGELDQEFEFEPISGDRDIQLITGAENDLKLLTEAITYPEFWDWTDGGLVNVGGQLKPSILYGDFRKGVAYFDSTGDARLAPQRFSNITTTDNINSSDTFLTSASVKDGGVGYRFIFPYVNNGQGFAQSTSIRLTRNNYSFINPQFPVVKFTSPITLQDYYCVVNPFSQTNDNMKVYDLQEPSNTEDQSGENTTTVDITEEVLYRRTISYIQSLQSKPVLEVVPQFKNIVLAGATAVVKYTQELKGYDGSILYSQCFDGDYILDNLQYNLSDFVS